MRCKGTNTVFRTARVVHFSWCSEKWVHKHMLHCILILLRLSQTYYVQVSTWMIRMESQLVGSGQDPRAAYKADVNSRASLFVQVCM